MVWFNYRRVPAIALAQADRRRRPRRQAVPLPRHVPAGLDDRRRTCRKAAPRSGGWTSNVAGSGVTGDLLAHSIDTAMWLNGPITRVVAKTETFVKERSTPSPARCEPVGIDDACMFLAEFANGSMGTFESTRYARGRKNFNTFEMNGADGSVYFDLEDPEYLQYFEYTQQQSGKKTESHLTGWRKIHVTNSEHPYMNRYWVPGTTIGYEHTFLNALADFVCGNRIGQADAARFPRGALKTQRVCDAVLASARSGQWMDTGLKAEPCATSADAT